MYSNDVHYLRLVVADRQEQLRRVAGESRLRRSSKAAQRERERVRQRH